MIAPTDHQIAEWWAEHTGYTMSILSETDVLNFARRVWREAQEELVRQINAPLRSLADHMMLMEACASAALAADEEHGARFEPHPRKRRRKKPRRRA